MPGMTLFEMRGRVREVAPNRSQAMIDGALNKRIRAVTQRDWADLLRFAALSIPDAYTTGTVALAPGSALVNGTGSGWPVSDLVNTTLASAVTDAPGYVDVYPASMAGIAVGQYLLLDAGGAAEIVVPVAVAGNRFRAYCQLNHTGGAALKASSLAGRQFRASSYVFTVMAALSASQLQLDMAYGGPPMSGAPYQIYLGYASISPTARRLLYAYDAIAGVPLGVNKTRDYLDAADPQRTATDDPQELVSMQPSAAGTMQWEIWPAKLSAYQIGVVYQDSWPALRQDYDLSPHFINPEIFIAGATADCLMAKVVPNARAADPYHDPDGAVYYTQQYKDMLDDAIDSDQGRYLTMLKNYQQQIAGPGNYNWLRSHAPWPNETGG